MPTLPQFLSQAFNGIALGSLLALIASGLSIILGALGVLNFAHGAMFMLGAYVAFVALGAWGSFGAALALGALPLPGWGQGIVNFGFFLYPLYRVQVIGMVAVLLLAFYVLLYRTRIGLVVRAGIEDATMVQLLGTNVQRMFLVVFSLGAMAAGIAGVIYAPLSSVIPNMGEPFLVECFVVIVIGGLGSFPGAVVGGIVVGEILSLTTLFNPAYAQAAIYAVMTLVLIVRPRGLFGTLGRA